MQRFPWLAMGRQRRGYVVNKQKHSNISHFPKANFDIVTDCVFRWAKALIEIFVCFTSELSGGDHRGAASGPQHPSQLAEILDRHTREVKQAEVGDILLPGMVYIAAPTSTC